MSRPGDGSIRPSPGGSLQRRCGSALPDSRRAGAVPGAAGAVRRCRSFWQCRAEGGRGLRPAAGCKSPLASVASFSVALRESRTCGAKTGTGVTH